jgi:hypothetical protein
MHGTPTGQCLNLGSYLAVTSDLPVVTAIRGDGERGKARQDYSAADIV